MIPSILALTASAAWGGSADFPLQLASQQGVRDSCSTAWGMCLRLQKLHQNIPAHLHSDQALVMPGMYRNAGILTNQAM